MKDSRPNGITYAEFRIGLEFYTGAGKWRCTDVGTRTIAAIRIDQYDDPSWLNGPPFTVAEVLFDEYDMEGTDLEPFD